jgi:hypothetical protein
MTTRSPIAEPAGALAVEPWEKWRGQTKHHRYFEGRRWTFDGDGGPHEVAVSIRGVQHDDGAVERWLTFTARHTPGGDVPDVRFDGIEPATARELGRLFIESADEAERDQATDEDR